MRVAGIQVLDPISLLICKAHAWNHRLQNEASNDAVHIEMLVEIVPQFIAEAKARKLDVSPQIAALRTAVRSCPLPLEMAFWESISLSAQ